MMMDISKYRHEFIVYIVDDEESIREILKETLVNAKYQVETFPTAEDAIERIREAPPHLIFSDIRMPGMTGIQLLGKVRELSRDIEFIIMTSHASIETAVEAMKLGAYDYIFKPFDNLTDVIKTADRTMERVYMKFQNEQLLQELGEKNRLLAMVNQRIAAENKEIQSMNELMHKLSGRLDPEGVLQVLVDELSKLADGKPVIFLKLMPNLGSLVASVASKIPLAQIKNLGINLSQYDPKTIPEVLMQPQKLGVLTEMMREVFQVSNFEPIPFIHGDQPVGIVVSFEKFEFDGAKRLIEGFLQISRVSYDNAVMAKRIHEMAVKDPLTALYNRRFFNEKLEEEMQRSRRTHYPLSLIYLDIDHFKKYNDTNGHPMGDVILKSVAQILAKTSRKTDIVARLGGEEFAIICAATSKEGAAIKAEKIRRVVESTKFPNGEKQPMGKLSISLGVSEYPSIVSDSQSLVRSADDALYQVKQAGRNRVCMAEAPKNFKPEFEPLPVPSGPEGRSGTGAA